MGWMKRIYGKKVALRNHMLEERDICVALGKMHTDDPDGRLWDCHTADDGWQKYLVLDEHELWIVWLDWVRSNIDASEWVECHSSVEDYAAWHAGIECYIELAEHDREHHEYEGCHIFRVV